MEKTGMQIQNNLNETKAKSEFDVGDVKSEGQYLRAKDFKTQEILKNIVFIEPVEHQLEREEEGNDGVKRSFKESWTVLVDFRQQQYLLRLSKKVVIDLRDSLKFGADMKSWAGKTFDLICIHYNTGNGFAVVL